MNDEAIRDLVLSALKQVAPETDVAALDPSRSFRDQTTIDSIDFLNFVLGVEQRLGLRIADADYPNLSSLDGCIAYLRTRIVAGQPSRVP